MDEFLLYVRLIAHLVTFAYLVSYRTQRTRKPLVSATAAGAAGVSLACAAHIVLIRPDGGQALEAVVATLCAVLIVRCGGNLAKVFRWKATQ